MGGDDIRKIRGFVLESNNTALGFWKNLRFDKQVNDYRNLEFED